MTPTDNPPKHVRAACPVCGAEVVPSGMATHQKGRQCSALARHRERLAAGWVEHKGAGLDVLRSLDGGRQGEAARALHHQYTSTTAERFGSSAVYAPDWLAVALGYRNAASGNEERRESEHVLHRLIAASPAVRARALLIWQLGGIPAVRALIAAGEL